MPFVLKLNMSDHDYRTGVQVSPGLYALTWQQFDEVFIVKQRKA